MKNTVGEIAKELNATLVGDENIWIDKISSLDEGCEGTISFLDNLKYEPSLYTTRASAVLVSKNFTPSKNVKPALLYVDNAYTSLAKLLGKIHELNESKNARFGREIPHYIAKTAAVGNNEYIGAFSYIGEGAIIGKNVKIFPQCYIGSNVEIGDNTTLFAGVKVYDHCKIGNHCVIHSGAVIGSDGFGFAPQKDGTYKSIPQIGNVVIKDRVSIGANTAVDCATFSSTLIKDGVKIDNLVQIGHNVVIGEDTVIAGQTGIAGSTKIGRQGMIGGQVGIVGHIEIEDRVIILAQSGISKDVPSGSMLQGSPAMERIAAAKSQVIYRNLDKLVKRVEQLEKNILSKK